MSFKSRNPFTFQAKDIKIRTLTFKHKKSKWTIEIVGKNNKSNFFIVKKYLTTIL